MSIHLQLPKLEPRIIEKHLDTDTVSNAALRALHLPERPDSAKEPLRYAIWRRFFSRIISVVDVDTAISGSDVRWPLPKPKPLPPLAPPQFNTTVANWAGAVVNNSLAETMAKGFDVTGTARITDVLASWTVPLVYPPLDAWDSEANAWSDGEWISGNWIGIDGYNEAAIFQVGTAHMVTAAGGVLSWTYWAFYEWYTPPLPGYAAPTMTVIGLPIAAGDVIIAWLDVNNVGPVGQWGNQYGTVTLSKAGTVPPGAYVSIPVQPPFGSASYPLNCDTAEWIVETPVNADGIPYESPNFGVTWFYNMSAVYDGNCFQQDLASLWMNPATLPPWNQSVPDTSPCPATVIDMAPPNGGVIAQAVAVTSNVLSVSYTSEGNTYVPQQSPWTVPP